MCKFFSATIPSKDRALYKLDLNLFVANRCKPNIGLFSGVYLAEVDLAILFRNESNKMRPVRAHSARFGSGVPRKHAESVTSQETGI
jgi:hypothetical protein